MESQSSGITQLKSPTFQVMPPNNDNKNDNNNNDNNKMFNLFCL
jgi:hypothetical protein